MGLFSKKSRVADLEQIFRDKYKDINQIVTTAHNELDTDIKLSMLYLANEKYNDLLALIDQGVNFERSHFESLQNSLNKEITMLKEL